MHVAVSHFCASISALHSFALDRLVTGVFALLAEPRASEACGIGGCENGIEEVVSAIEE